MLHNKRTISYWSDLTTEEFQLFPGQRPQPLFWACSRAARVEVTLSGILNRLNYRVTFTVCK